MMSAPIIRCPFCKRRRATFLCDAPVGCGSYVGHPPRYLVNAYAMHCYWKKIDMSWTVTCDRPICDECAVEVARGIDYCPRCIERIKQRAAEKRRSKNG